MRIFLKIIFSFKCCNYISLITRSGSCFPRFFSLFIPHPVPLVSTTGSMLCFPYCELVKVYATICSWKPGLWPEPVSYAHHPPWAHSGTRKGMVCASLLGKQNSLGTCCHNEPWCDTLQGHFWITKTFQLVNKFNMMGEGEEGQNGRVVSLNIYSWKLRTRR